MTDLRLLKFEIERRSGLPDIGAKISTQEYFYARAVFYEIARRDAGLSLASIGEAVGKDHATVLNAKASFQKYMKKSEKYRNIYHILLRENFIAKNILNPEDIKKMEDEFEVLQKRVYELQFALDDRNENKIFPSHQPLIDLINKIPEYHIENVKRRLEPMIAMLEKPSIHNYLPKN